MSVHLQFQQEVQHFYTIVCFKYWVKNDQSKIANDRFYSDVRFKTRVCGDYTSLTQGESTLFWIIFPKDFQAVLLQIFNVSYFCIPGPGKWEIMQEKQAHLLCAQHASNMQQVHFTEMTALASCWAGIWTPGCLIPRAVLLLIHCSFQASCSHKEGTSVC